MDLMSRIASDKIFAQQLQLQAQKVKLPSSTEQDAEDLLKMIARTPEELAALKSMSPSGDPKVASITITTITTLTTATTAF